MVAAGSETSNRPVRVLKYGKQIADDKKERPKQATLTIHELLGMEGIQKEELPLAWVIDRKDLAKLRPFDEKVEDRGTKIKSQGLSIKLLKRPLGRIPMIEAETYGSHGRLRNGIKRLLKNAVEKEERRTYLIGITETLFLEVWEERSVKEEKIATASQNDAPALVDSAHTFDSPLIGELHNRCKIPENLTVKYKGESEEAALVR